MRDRRIPFDRIQIDQGEPMPDWRRFQAVVAMGGPMGANDDDSLSWLAHEKQQIAEAVHAGLPFWGVCLGAQLLAASLGARVYRGERAEIGIYSDVELTQAARGDPVFAGTPSRITTLQWHADTFDLPRGATLLASSAVYANQAFAWRRAYGLQFHLEVSSELAASWLEVPSYAAELTRTLGAPAPDALAEQLHELDETTPLARRMFGRWIERCVA
jgi:GMP synthase-like glutamine amidotransferase